MLCMSKDLYMYNSSALVLACKYNVWPIVLYSSKIRLKKPFNCNKKCRIKFVISKCIIILLDCDLEHLYDWNKTWLLKLFKFSTVGNYIDAYILEFSRKSWWLFQQGSLFSINSAELGTSTQQSTVDQFFKYIIQTNANFDSNLCFNFLPKQTVL